MRVNGITICEVVEDMNVMQMAMCIMGNLNREKPMGKESTNGRMEKYMTENGNRD